MSLESNNRHAMRFTSNGDAPRVPLTQLSVPVGDQAVLVFNLGGSDRNTDGAAACKEAAKAFIGVDTAGNRRVAGIGEDTLSCWFGVLRER